MRPCEEGRATRSIKEEIAIRRKERGGAIKRKKRLGGRSIKVEGVMTRKEQRGESIPSSLKAMSICLWVKKMEKNER